MGIAACAIGYRVVTCSPSLWRAAACAAARPAAEQDTLISAAERGEILVVRKLLAEGVPVNSRDGRGRTALLAATQRNQVEIARLLINEGADVNAKDFIQDTPFLYAGAEGRIEILKLILPAAPDLTSINRFGGTALIPACSSRPRRGGEAAARDRRSNKDHVNNLGWTALLEAVIARRRRAAADRDRAPA